MTEIRHVVFDLGQVLIRWDPEAPYRRLISDPDERRRFLTEVVSPTNGTWNRIAGEAGRTRRPR